MKESFIDIENKVSIFAPEKVEMVSQVFRPLGQQMTKTKGRRFNTMSYIDDIYTVENNGEAGTCYTGYNRETAVKNAHERLISGGYYQDQAGRWCSPD